MFRVVLFVTKGNLLRKTELLAVIWASDQPQGPHAAESFLVLENKNVCPTPCRPDSGACAGRPAAYDDNIHVRQDRHAADFCRYCLCLRINGP